ncbi:MAG: DUF2726 domain-containing protein [Pseudomonadales bacterium]|nr:DUF2726 domain-containing protein [Pseudomonadales bacterium]
MENLYIYLLVCIFSVALIALIWIRSNAKSGASEPEQKSGPLFTDAERSFYGLLCQVSQGRAIVFGKVSAMDVLKAQDGQLNRKTAAALKRVSQQHFDYVLCKHDDLSVIAVVELDAGAQQSDKSLKQDQLLDAACAATGLKLHRFKVSKVYDVRKIRETLFCASQAKQADKA